MAVGGLPSKRQGRLGRPKGHRHPHAMVSFFIFFAISHSSLHLLPSSPSHILSFSSLARSLSFSFSSSVYSISYSFSFPKPPSFFCLQHLVRLTSSQAFRSHPTGPGSIPAYPYKALPFWPSPPGHVIGPIRSFSRPTLRGWNRSDGLRLTLRNLP